MKNFDKNRFLQTLKWNIITEKKTLFTHTLAFVAGFLLLQIFYILVLNMFQQPGKQSILVGMLMCISTAGFLTSYYASGIIGNARTKEQRTTALMLPASNLEKFTARLVYVLIAIPLLIVIGLAVATLLRMGIQVLLGHDNIISGIGMVTDENGFEMFELAVSHLFMMSLFVLGGVLFRKHPCIWTWVTTMGFILTVALIAGLIIRLTMPAHHHMHILVNIPDLVVDLVFVALTVFNFWLSYRLFCRLQVVQHKWFNL